MMEEVLPQGWTTRMMKMGRGALAEEEGGVEAKEEVEEEQLMLVDSHPSGRLMLAPNPPSLMDPTIVSIS